jgi:hypothetical protein
MTLSIDAGGKPVRGVFHQVVRDSGLSGVYFARMAMMLTTTCTTTRTIRGRRRAG